MWLVHIVRLDVRTLLYCTANGVSRGAYVSLLTTHDAHPVTGSTWWCHHSTAVPGSEPLCQEQVFTTIFMKRVRIFNAVIVVFRGLDATPIMMALSGASAYPEACQALSSMLSKNALNPADVTKVSTRTGNTCSINDVFCLAV